MDNTTKLVISIINSLIIINFRTNLKLGIKSGMVKPKSSCDAGIIELKKKYKDIIMSEFIKSSISYFYKVTVEKYKTVLATRKNKKTIVIGRCRCFPRKPV